MKRLLSKETWASFLLCFPSHLFSSTRVFFSSHLCWLLFCLSLSPWNPEQFDFLRVCHVSFQRSIHKWFDANSLDREQETDLNHCRKQPHFFSLEGQGTAPVSYETDVNSVWLVILKVRERTGLLLSFKSTFRRNHTDSRRWAADQGAVSQARAMSVLATSPSA